MCTERRKRAMAMCGPVCGVWEAWLLSTEYGFNWLGSRALCFFAYNCETGVYDTARVYARKT